MKYTLAVLAVALCASTAHAAPIVAELALSDTAEHAESYMRNTRIKGTPWKATDEVVNGHCGIYKAMFEPGAVLKSFDYEGVTYEVVEVQTIAKVSQGVIAEPWQVKMYATRFYKSTAKGA